MNPVTFASPPLPTLCRAITLFCLASVFLDCCTLSRTFMVLRCTPWETQSPWDVALLLLPSFPSTLLHHFALAAGLFSALFSPGPAALGQLLTSGMLYLLLLFHFPPFPSAPLAF